MFTHDVFSWVIWADELQKWQRSCVSNLSCERVLGVLKYLRTAYLIYSSVHWYNKNWWYSTEFRLTLRILSGYQATNVSRIGFASILDLLAFFSLLHKQLVHDEVFEKFFSIIILKWQLTNQWIKSAAKPWIKEFVSKLEMSRDV